MKTRKRPRRTRTLNELNERLKVGIRTFGPIRSYISKRTAPCFFRERQGAVLCCLVEMRTMKRLSFNRTHRIQSKSSSPIALIMPKRSDHSRTHFHRACVVGLFRTRFLCALLHAIFRNARPIGLSQRLPNKQAFPRPFPQYLPQVPPQQTRTGRRSPNHVPILQKMAEICSCERS